MMDRRKFLKALGLVPIVMMTTCAMEPAFAASVPDTVLTWPRKHRIAYIEPRIYEIRSRVRYTYIGNAKLDIPYGAEVKRLWADEEMIYDRNTGQHDPDLFPFCWHLISMDLSRFGNKFPEITAEFAS